MSEYNADVLIHIDEDINNDDIHRLEKEISCTNGVQSACTHINTRHLMLVEYEPEKVRALDLLHMVTGRGLHAELVGLL